MPFPKITILFLFILTFIGGVNRLYRLSENPPGATLDAISIGYNAFTIRTAGIDQDGNRLPLGHFRSLGDYKLPLQIYLVALSQMKFGNSLLAIRLPSAIFGTLTIPLVFFLSQVIFEKLNIHPKKNQILCLFSTFLFTISPWHSFHSRLGLETSIGLFFALATILFLFLALKKPKILLIAALCLLLTAYTYHAYWVFLPPLIFIFFIFHRSYIFLHRKILLLAIILITIGLTPLLTEKNQGNTARFNQSFISSEHIAKRKQEAQQTCGTENFCINANITMQLINHMLNQYVTAFSFITWYGPSKFDPVDVVPFRGLFYFIELPLLLIGIIALIKIKNKATIFLLSWLLLYPLPIVVTNSITAARMYELLPLPYIIETLGFYDIIKKQRYLAVPILLFLCFIFARFVADLWFVYPFGYSRQIDYGMISIRQSIDKEPYNVWYVEEPLFHRLHLFYFYNILPQYIQPPQWSTRGRTITQYQNIILVERGYLPPETSNNRLISFQEDIPKNYEKIGVVPLKSGEIYAYVSAPKKEKL